MPLYHIDIHNVYFISLLFTNVSFMLSLHCFHYCCSNVTCCHNSCISIFQVICNVFLHTYIFKHHKHIYVGLHALPFLCCPFRQTPAAIAYTIQQCSLSAEGAAGNCRSSFARITPNEGQIRQLSIIHSAQPLLQSCCKCQTDEATRKINLFLMASQYITACTKCLQCLCVCIYLLFLHSCCVAVLMQQ